jgi:hypothetical protein
MDGTCGTTTYTPAPHVQSQHLRQQMLFVSQVHYASPRMKKSLAKQLL